MPVFTYSMYASELESDLGPAPLWQGQPVICCIHGLVFPRRISRRVWPAVSNVVDEPEDNQQIHGQEEHPLCQQKNLLQSHNSVGLLHVFLNSDTPEEGK